MAENETLDTAMMDADGFLTADALREKARFTFEEDILEIPELGGKLKIRALSVGQRRSLMARYPDDPKNWELKHTAMGLAAYVTQPTMNEKEWVEAITPWPAAALDKLQDKIRALGTVSEEEEATAATEFPASDD
jgi:hypothetical protein